MGFTMFITDLHALCPCCVLETVLNAVQHSDSLRTDLASTLNDDCFIGTGLVSEQVCAASCLL